MPLGIMGWAIWGVCQVVLTLVFKLIYKLAENAMIGWGDDQIAAYFGITSPRFTTAFEWAVPFTLAALILFIYHSIHTRMVSSPVVPTDIKPNIDAADAFEKIIQQSKWAKNTIKTIDVSRYFYPEKTHQSQKTEWALSYKLANDIHDHLRLGTITAWGKFSKSDGDNTPERLIAADEWDDIRLILDRRKKEKGLQVSSAYGDVDRGRYLSYLQVRFCEQQVYKLYPLAWRKREAVVFSPELIQHSLPPQATSISPPPSQKTELEWNIEGNPESINFLGLSVGSSGLQAHHFWLRGWNRTLEPITAPRAYIRAENTAEEFDGLFNAGDGKLLSADKIKTIPVGAMMDITTPFRPDRKPIPLSTFLAEFVPFTFFFTSPEISYRKTITKELIEHRVRLFQDHVNAKAMKRPIIQIRTDEDGA